MDAQGIDAVVLYPSIGLFVPYLPELDARRVGGGVRRVQRLDRRSTARPTRAGSPAMAVVPPGSGARRGGGPPRGRARAAGRDGAAEPPLRTQPRRRRLRPALRRAARRPASCSRCTRGSACAAPTIGRDRFDGFAVRHVCSHPLEQMAAMVAWCSTARSSATRAAGRVPRVGHRLAAVLARPPRRAPRVDGGHRDAGLSLTPSEYFARQCVISTRPGGRARGVRDRARSGPTT